MPEQESTAGGTLLRVDDRRAAAVAALPVREFNPIDLLRAALDRGATMEQLEKFTEIAERWKANQAREAYAAAMAQAHANPPQIIKNKNVDRGNAGSYKHATHDEVAIKVGAWLSAYGFSHAWRMEQKDSLIYVTCTITHALGHAEAFTMFGGPDTTGQKSALQAIASTTTFLQRYTLLGATGLSSAEMRAADNDAGKPTLSEQQVADLRALMTEIGSTELAFLKYMQVDSLEQIPAASYSACVAALEQKRRK